MPLLWIVECFGDEGFAVLRKRYLMLALCEDAVRGAGAIDANNRDLLSVGLATWHERRDSP